MSAQTPRQNIQANPDTGYDTSWIVKGFGTQEEPRWTYARYPEVFKLNQREAVPESGTVIIRLLGTNNYVVLNVMDVNFGNLNDGNSLPTGVFHEEVLHLMKGETISITGATVLGIFFRCGV